MLSEGAGPSAYSDSQTQQTQLLDSQMFKVCSSGAHVSGSCSCGIGGDPGLVLGLADTEAIHHHQAARALDRRGACQVPRSAPAVRATVAQDRRWAGGAPGPPSSYLHLAADPADTDVGCLPAAEHIGSKTAVQIRSHAQKFFNKLERKKEAGEAASGGELSCFRDGRTSRIRP